MARRTLIAPPLADSDIVAKANQLMADYVALKGGRNRLIVLDFGDVFSTIIRPRFGIEIIERQRLGSDSNGSKILGVYDFVDRTALIDECIERDSGDPRRVFTIIHEVVGHGVLQGDWVLSQLSSPAVEPCFETEETISFASASRWERQANLCAAHVGAPTWLVVQSCACVLGMNRPIRWIGPGTYCLGQGKAEERVHCDSLKTLAWHLGRRLRHRFGGLSAEAISIRALQSRVLIDGTSVASEIDHGRPGPRPTLARVSLCRTAA